MINIRRHNPVLQQRLNAYLAAGDAAGLRDFLAELPNTAFRTAGFMLGNSLLQQLAEDRFWHFFETIVPAHPKAYLGTFLKAAAEKCAHRGLAGAQTALQRFATVATPIDRKKTLEKLLPALQDTDEAETLMRLFSTGDPHDETEVLLRTATTRSYFLLMRRLRTMEEEHETLHACCLQLMRKGDHLSFNMACVVQAYFGLKDLPGTFSLHVEPYELSLLESNYEDFCKIIRK